MNRPDEHNFSFPDFLIKMATKRAGLCNKRQKRVSKLFFKRLHWFIYNNACDRLARPYLHYKFKNTGKTKLESNCKTYNPFSTSHLAYCKLKHTFLCNNSDGCEVRPKSQACILRSLGFK